jgi:serine/threonine protein phosphatase PrpC
VDNPVVKVVRGGSATGRERTASSDRIIVEAAAVANRGRSRAFGADAYLMLPEARLLAVVGGIGADPLGERAARRVVDAVLGEARERSPRPMDLLVALDWLDIALRQSSRAATYTGITLSERAVHLAHVGHGRCYRMRDGELQRLSEDHTFAAQCLRDGVMTVEQAARSPVRALLTRALGAADAKVDVADFDALPGDLYVLLSHGLHTFVSDEAITAILAGEDDLERAAVRLAFSAQAGGSHFDVTAIVARAASSSRRER